MNIETTLSFLSFRIFQRFKVLPVGIWMKIHVYIFLFRHLKKYAFILVLFSTKFS